MCHVIEKRLLDHRAYSFLCDSRLLQSVAISLACHVGHGGLKSQTVVPSAESPLRRKIWPSLFSKTCREATTLRQLLSMPKLQPISALGKEKAATIRLFLSVRVLCTYTGIRLARANIGSGGVDTWEQP